MQAWRWSVAKKKSLSKLGTWAFGCWGLLLHSYESSLSIQGWEDAFPKQLAKEWGCTCPCLFKDTSRLLPVSLNLSPSLVLSCSQHETHIVGGSLGQNTCSVLCLVLIDGRDGGCALCMQNSVQGDTSFSAELLSASTLKKRN